MNSDLQLTLLELIRRLNGITAIESGGFPRRRGRSADSTSQSVEITKEEEDSSRCIDPTGGTSTQDTEKEPIHDLRPRPKDRKGAVVE
uniref:X protein n=1 Tax=Canary bornavirus 1 TaxID=1715288 RepID=M9V5J9_9MONO|nr:X protein [Canary bornavirus 1]AGJ74890.1 X protein [Canary bornavirus 1]